MFGGVPYQSKCIGARIICSKSVMDCTLFHLLLVCRSIIAEILTGYPTFKCWSEQERFVEDYPYVVTRVSVSPEDNDVFAISGKNTKGN